MERIIELASELNTLIRESEIYSEYVSARDRLAGHANYKEMVDGFRKKQMEHELQKMNGEMLSIDEFALANEYADICLIAVCNDFFCAEMELLKLIKSVNMTVFGNIEVGD